MNTNTFKSFKYKTKLVGKTLAQLAPNQANGVLENAAIVVSLRYLSEF